MECFRPRTLYDLLDGIRLRPGLYFGVESLPKVSGFLSGYQLACEANDVALDDEAPRFDGFTDWLAAELGVKPGAAGWEELLATHAGGDGLAATEAFFEFLDRYRGSRLVVARRDLLPPRRRLNVDEEVTRVEIVERPHDGAWFVWFSSNTGTGCRRMGHGRTELFDYVDTTLGPGVLDESAFPHGSRPRCDG